AHPAAAAGFHRGRAERPAVPVVLVGRSVARPGRGLVMDSDLAREVAGPAQVIPVAPVIEFDGVSKWYGNVIGVNKLTLAIPAGITGLLGPNGAGKSTLLQLATGQLRPSQGRVRVLGHPVWNKPA